MKSKHDIQHNQLENILQTENEQLGKLHDLISESIREEQLIVKNLRNKPEEPATSGQRIADKVAAFGGSWKFIILFGSILAAWILLNLLLGKSAFDQYPFILLNLMLSTIAALQAPVIMMSQNRKEEKDRQRAENDYMVNLKAEIEIRNLHQKVNLLMEEQFKTLLDIQQYQVEMLESMTEKKKTG